MLNAGELAFVSNSTAFRRAGSITSECSRESRPCGGTWVGRHWAKMADLVHYYIYSLSTTSLSHVDVYLVRIGKVGRIVSRSSDVVKD